MGRGVGLLNADGLAGHQLENEHAEGPYVDQPWLVVVVDMLNELTVKFVAAFEAE
jgi:hypothetical protein